MKKSIPAGMLAAALLLVSGTAFGAAQTKAQQKCINTLNKGMAKVNGTRNKVLAKCIADRAKDDGVNAFTCAINPPKVIAAQEKNCTAETAACTEAPEFGHSGCSTTNFVAALQATVLMEDVYGSGINNGVTICADDGAGCKCQGKATKSFVKLNKAYQKGFNKCKKLGLKSQTAAIEDAAALAACLDDDAGGKIPKTETKLETLVGKACEGVATPFATGFCMNLTGSNLSDCLLQRVRCAHCRTVQITDNLPVNCELFDNAAADFSCPNLD